ncbi:MAG TPA: hypothetical protein VKB88_10980 [Bryobacteraceae bacterium]|nr:hypothetical protein [Bryobacteraceae bacterium]
MQIALGILALLGVGLAVALGLVLRKVAFSSGDLPVTAEWIDELSVERYRPMLRLLDGKDLEFLRAQPGFTPTMEKQLRRQRCQVFRAYLRSLSLDFRRVSAAIKLLMLYSNNDRSDLAGALLHHQLVFGLSFLQVECAVLLYRWGLCDVNVGDLMKIFDMTRVELRSLVPSSALAV